MRSVTSPDGRTWEIRVARTNVRWREPNDDVEQADPTGIVLPALMLGVYEPWWDWSN
jgi:hypothetical protein